MGKTQSTEAQPTKPGAEVKPSEPGAAATGLPNGMLKHEPAAEAMELDGPQAPADGDIVEQKTPPRWRWRLLSFNLLPGTLYAALDNL